MKNRQLGKNGPRVSAISMGRGSQAIKLEDEPMVQSFNTTIRRAFELGINFFDWSDAYWATRHEVLLGRAVKGFRDQILVSTKFGNIDLPDGEKATNGRPEYVQQCCEASLKRMDVDVIDVYYLHRVDPAVPIEETTGATGGRVVVVKLCTIGSSSSLIAWLPRPMLIADTRGPFLPSCRYFISWTSRELASSGIGILSQDPRVERHASVRSNARS